jgi:dihydropyrimidinase
MTTFDTLIRAGRIATALGDYQADIGIRDGRIVAIGDALGTATQTLDAAGKIVCPGGVDAHAHIEQRSAAGLMNADTFESATTAAAMGGTTTVISFAAQHVGLSLRSVVEDYAALAQRGALIDYSFHMIVADATDQTLLTDIPALTAAGHGSIKVFMTYDRLKVDDEKLLDVLLAARRAGAMVCVHAENHGMIAWTARKLLEKGLVAPKYHAVSHPRGSEADAIARLIHFSELVDQPVMVFHVSTAEGCAVIREARGRGLKIFAETCPQYLFLTAEDLDKPGLEGAKWMCSPPPRTAADQEALWRALDLGDLQLVSSDHAPYAFDATGKLAAGPQATFKDIANGLPGLEVRLALLFDAMVSKGRLGLAKFVEITATAPARLYDLGTRKSAIAIGADADLVLWDPDRRVTLSDVMMHDRAGYSPYAGRVVQGWPTDVLRRGEIIVSDGRIRATPGTGRFLPRSGGASAKPRGVIDPDIARLL